MKWPWSNKDAKCPVCGSKRLEGQKTCGKAVCKGKIAHVNYPTWFKKER